MTIETLTRAQLANELGYKDIEGGASDRAIAQFMRDAMSRWGMCPRRELLRYAREQLRAGDLPTDTVPDILRRLVALGECAEVAVGHEAYVVPAESRWVASGGRLAVVLGPIALSDEIPRLPTLDSTDVAVRILLWGDEQAARLEARGVREVSLAEWLHPLGFLRHGARRAGGAIRTDRLTLVTFWEQLIDAVSAEGLHIGPETEIRAVAGEPGDFFGRYSASTLEGRWRETTPDGVWCAYRRGYGDGHWLPTLVSVDGGERRVLDLFDNDEWRWALLARARAVGSEEIVRRSGDEVHVTWPLPAQLRAALDILGVPSGVWRWRIAADAPDLWALLK